MSKIGRDPLYRRRRFPAEIISHAVWLYSRFPLRLRMIEDMWRHQGVHRHEIGKQYGSPGLADLLAYSRPGDTLAIVRLDRLGRSLTELLATVTMLRERQIALLSLEENIDTSSAAGELLFHVFGAIAHCSR